MPRLRAVRMNGCSSTSSSSPRNTWVSTAPIGNASVSVGRISAAIPSLPDTGSSLRVKEKMMSSTMPITNVGVEDRVSSTPEAIDRQGRRRAVSTATVTASNTATTAAASASWTVWPSCSPIARLTEIRCW